MTNGDINWEAIAARLPKDKQPKVQPAMLPEREFWIFIAATAAMKRSLAANSQSLLVSQIRRHQQEWFENIKFLAAQDNMSFEDKFVQLCLGEDSQS